MSVWGAKSDEACATDSFQVKASMMARRGVLGAMMGGLAAFVAGCNPFRNRDDFHFKMTVEVETPQGLVSGSSVFLVKAFGSRDLVAGGRGSRLELYGEAVAVDLPDGRTLFALLRTDNELTLEYLSQGAIKAMDPGFKHNWLESSRRIAARSGITSPSEFPRRYYPLLVMFGDIADPLTARRVDPVEIEVRRVVAEVAEGPVTEGIRSRLPWLSQLRNKSLDGKTIHDGSSFANDLAPSLFSRLPE